MEWIDWNIIGNVIIGIMILRIANAILLTTIETIGRNK